MTRAAATSSAARFGARRGPSTTPAWMTFLPNISIFGVQSASGAIRYSAEPEQRGYTHAGGPHGVYPSNLTNRGLRCMRVGSVQWDQDEPGDQRDRDQAESGSVTTIVLVQSRSRSWRPLASPCPAP